MIPTEVLVACSDDDLSWPKSIEVAVNAIYGWLTAGTRQCQNVVCDPERDLDEVHVRGTAT